MHLPSPRGPLSAAVVAVLGGRTPAPVARAEVAAAVGRVTEPLADDDLQLALAICYELHHAGFDDVDDGWEWDPDLLGLRRALEHRFETALLRLCPRPDEPVPGDRREVAAALRAEVDGHAGPPLSTYLLRDATLEQYREFAAQRSVYHLREADPHTWAIPRLRGRAKAALVEIQVDEYGGGRPGRMHAEMFAATLRALGLDDSYGAHWPVATAETFTQLNLMSLLGLHRRHRGALLGQLAVLEMDSTRPNRRYANGLRRLGQPAAATAYYDEHVEADAVHEQLAAVDMCGSFVEDEPLLWPDVLWGARCGLELDARASARLLARWGVDGEQRCA